MNDNYTKLTAAERTRLRKVLEQMVYGQPEQRTLQMNREQKLLSGAMLLMQQESR